MRAIPVIHKLGFPTFEFLTENQADGRLEFYAFKKIIKIIFVIEFYLPVSPMSLQ